MQNISFSFLYGYPSLIEALNDTLNLNKSTIKKWITQKNFLKKIVTPQMEVSLPINLINHLMINPQYQGPYIEVSYQDDHFIVLNKPAHVHSHPLSYDEKDNCLSFLRSIGLDRYLQVNHKNYDRGLLYRLDFSTSGLLIYVKNQETHNFLRENFHQQIKSKVYLCVVPGLFNKKGTIRNIIRPSLEKGKKMVVVNKKISNFSNNLLSKNNFVAEINVHLLDYNKIKDVSLVKVELKQGIRHQIRVQMANMGFPILGDTLYGGIECNRIYLHAYFYTMLFSEKEYIFKQLNAPLFDEFFDLNCSL